MEKEKQKKPYLNAILNVSLIENADIVTASDELIEETPGQSTPSDGWTWQIRFSKTKK